jgi:transposase
MERHDMRTLTSDARLERRRHVVTLRKRGWTHQAIAEQTELSRQGVSAILRRYEREGTRGLADKPRGRTSGEQRALSPTQEATIRTLICDKTPDQLTLGFALWNRLAVRELIRRRCGVTLTPQGVGNYLARWGLSPQQPIKKAYEQCPKAVQAWLDTRYPEIAQRARVEGAEIHWGDETGLRSDDVRGRSYAPRGQTPEIRVSQRRDRVSVLSTVTNRGTMRWKVFEGAMHAGILLDFMKRLIKDADGRKVFLVLDNLKVHHAKPVTHWLGEHAEAIEVFYLPSYSPELNPDELLNADLKAAVTRRAPSRTKGHLKQVAVSHLRRLQHSPQRVRNYFKHEPVRYAA